jgi:hypothetical protein
MRKLSIDDGPVSRTPITQAMAAWIDYTVRAESLIQLTYEGFGRIQAIPELLRILAEDPSAEDEAERIEAAEEAARVSRAESEEEFPFLHAHSLLGLWGALECMVEDLFVARLSDNPSHLEDDAFAKIKIPAKLLAEGASENLYRAILTESSRSTSADLALGVSKFERLLRLVDLDGAVPRAVKDAVFSAQQVRNVWAHRAGAADERFVLACPDFGVAEGDVVNLNHAVFSQLMHGIHMYGYCIISRVVAQRWDNLPSSLCPGYEDSTREIQDHARERAARTGS